MAELESDADYWAVNTWGANGLVSRRVGTATAFYTWDERGTCAERLDSSGNVLTAVSGDDYGLCNETNNPGDPFGLWGGQWGYFADAETGLYLLGQRYYDKNTARFINQDPIGTAGGINVYRYAGNNPETWADPLGLKPRFAVIFGRGTGTPGVNLINPGNLTVAGELDAYYSTLGYDVIFKFANTPDDLVAILANVQGAAVLAHGTPVVCWRRGTFTADKIRRVRRDRDRNGQGNLNVLLIYSCGVMADRGDVQAYESIADGLFGFAGSYYPHRTKDDLFGAGGAWYKGGLGRYTFMAMSHG